MKNIVGKIRHVVYHNTENGYLVAVFKVNKTDVSDSYNVTITGSMPVVIDSFDLSLNGNLVYNEKYKKEQFNFFSVEQIFPSEGDKIFDFLVSPLVKGCGKATAKKIVDAYKEEALEKIKDIDNLYKLGISEKACMKIFASINNLTSYDEIISKLQDMNFSIEEACKIYNEYKDSTLDVIENNFYALKDIISFKKLDSIYVTMQSFDDAKRVYACILEVMKFLSFSYGHTYYNIDMIKTSLREMFSIYLSIEDEEVLINKLVLDEEVVIENDKIYLKEYYDYEVYISKKLVSLNKDSSLTIDDFDTKLKVLEDRYNITYDEIQRKAIRSALTQNITIISGGPGVGKTTILKSIVRLIIEEEKLSRSQVSANLALLAPTGRASKKMSMSTNEGASTIHRFLKWNKEDDSFEYNEENKVSNKFVIIDECSMIDIKLFYSLLSALKDGVKLILVGDCDQLPPVGAGAVFTSMISSDVFNFISLNKIYRQSENSYIPDLAYCVKTGELDESFLTKKDDYNFIPTSSENLKTMLNQVVFAAKSKGIEQMQIQVLVPMYKGINGIDNLNVYLRNVFNPSDFEKREITYNSVVYREKDKIIVLNNDVEKNIFNGDIGIIKSILKEGKETVIKLEIDGNIITVSKNYLKNLSHAYAISIHKSQGSEFEHVIMPICSSYYRMMYKKLIYTGVSRAKQSLIIIGSPEVFYKGASNNIDALRNTTLKDKILSIIS